MIDKVTFDRYRKKSDKKSRKEGLEKVRGHEIFVLGNDGFKLPSLRNALNISIFFTWMSTFHYLNGKICELSHLKYLSRTLLDDKATVNLANNKPPALLFVSYA